MIKIDYFTLLSTNCEGCSEIMGFAVTSVNQILSVMSLNPSAEKTFTMLILKCHCSLWCVTQTSEEALSSSYFSFQMTF